MHSDRDAFSCECFLLGPCVDKGNSSTRAKHGALSHSIVIDAADQPHIVYDEVVPRSIMKQEVLVNVHSQATPGNSGILQNWL
jgi:hypothetical protein